MDRSLIAPWKAEEKELSKKLYTTLQGLAILQPFSEELKKCCSEDMFSKPNQHAFFHVMHFLFCVYDATEFKKRFYWPIVDKRGESLFRTTTVEYLKQISNKHNLQWNIKSHLVVIPGGIKFINFLLELSSLIVEDCIAQRERQMPNEVLEMSGKPMDWNLARLVKRNKILKEFTSKYVTDIDEAINKYRETTAVLNNALDEMAKKIGLPVTVMLSDEFGRDFHASNVAAFENKQLPAAFENVQLLEPLKTLKHITEQILENDNNKSNKEIKIALQSIHEKHAQPFTMDAAGTEISMQSLITAFNSIYAELMPLVQDVNQITHSTVYMNEELEKLRTELQDAEFKLNDLQEKYQTTILCEISGSTHSDIVCKNPAIDALLAKYVSTPPIRLSLAETGHGISKRFPLLDFQAHDNIENFLNQTQVTPISERTLIKTAKLNQSLKSLNSTLNGNKVTDADHMMRTLMKSTKKAKTPRTFNFNQERLDSSIYLLHNKFQQNEPTHFDSSAMDDISSIENAKTLLGNFSPNIKGHLLEIQRLTSESANAELLLHKKKLTAVEKMQSDFCDLHNLSTSPSGRLQPLAYETKSVPQIQLNDSYIQPTQMEHNNYLPNVTENCENNQNVLNLKTSTSSSIKNIQDEEELFNISDSVLNDISD